MNEQSEVTPPENKPQPKKLEVYTRLPDGSVVNIFDLMEQHKRNLETEMGTGSLRAGDLIAFQYPNEQGTTNEMVFDVKSSEWTDLGMSGNFAPHPTLVGRLDGPNLPSEVTDNDVTFIGSGFGGSMVSPAILATGRSPYFHVAGGEYRAPYVDYFEIFRKDEQGNLQPLDLNQLDTEARGKTAKHDERVAKAEQLMEKFGFKFDFREGSKSTDDYFGYEDERYIAEFRSGMAMGNQLVIYDKQLGQWMEMKYYNSKNDDFLQVAFANISPNQIKDEFCSMTDESGVHRSRVSITTFASSGRYGIEAINYKASDDETAKTLQIPKWIPDNVANPNIQIWPDGQIEVPEDYPIIVVEKQNPGTIEKIKNSVRATTSTDDVTTLNLNGKNVQLKNPDVEIDRVVQHMSANKEKPTAAGMLSKAGRAIGQFIRKGNS